MSNKHRSRELTGASRLSEKLVDGIIVCSSRLPDDDLKKALDFYDAGVLLNRTLNSDDVIVLRIDDVEGGQAAANHLIQSGHRSIGFLAGPGNSFSGQQRFKGYRRALEDAGPIYNPDWVKHCLPMVETGQETARDLLDQHSEITALFCYNDLVAVGALKACADLDYKVPDDIAIVGFDDIMLASLVTPPLTTCRVPRYEMGVQAARMVLAQVGEKRTTPSIDELVETKLIIRASAP